jgi:hypothetical protein
MSAYGPFRPSWRVAGLVVIGGRTDIGQNAENDVVDPKRHFATINYRIAKGLFDHLVGGGE